MIETDLPKNKGIYIRHLIFIVAITTILLSGLAFFSNVQVKKIFLSLVDAEINYSQGLGLGYKFQSASNKMTKAVQHFVETNDSDYLDEYIYELKENTREKAIEKIPSSDDERLLLKLAKAKSDALLLEEFHAIKLMLPDEFFGTRIPQEILNFELTDEEKSLSFSERQEKARQIIFGTMYNTLKDDVNNRVNDYIQLSLSREEVTVTEYTNFMNSSIIFQRIILLSCIFVIIAVLVILYFQVVLILQKYVTDISKDKQLKPRGVFELQYLANMYNVVSENKNNNLRALKRKADLDFLTGVANRGAFEQYVKDYTKSPSTDKGAFMLIDLDNFKKINDTFGHAMGDLVLKKIADILNSTFRNDDFVSRIGGDEFAIWFPDLTEENVHYIVDRINTINKDLILPSREMPSCSLSAGISFFTQGETYKSLYKKADIALYKVKENGRCGCKIFEQ
ncbi:MAG: GGDEF domain-containing protein [Treponema bryantii]|nr:GGDEF domain-containing protein [Treponema bryantii]